MGRPQIAPSEFICKIINQFADALTPCFNNDIRCLAIEALPNIQERFQRIAWVVGTQQWSAAIAAGTLPQVIETRMQVNYRSRVRKYRAIFVLQNSPATGREDDTVARAKFFNELRLAQAESRFTFEFKNGTDSDASLFVHFLVGVEKHQVQLARQCFADRAFPGSRHAYQVDIWLVPGHFSMIKNVAMTLE